MMEVSYKRDVNHSFLVIRPENEVDTKAYPVRMVLGNVIPGLLPCRLQKADGHILLYYDITIRQPLSKVYERLNYAELKEIYQGFLKIFEQMEMFLLDTNQLLLEPEYVYVDKKEGGIYLCYLPGYERAIQMQLRCFTEYLLPRIEHQDSRGVMFGYSMYRLLVEKRFQMEAVQEILHRSEEEGREKEEYEVSQVLSENRADNQGEVVYPEENDEKKCKISQKKVWLKDMMLLLLCLFLFGGFVFLRQWGYFSYVTLPVMLAAFLCIVLGMGLLLAADSRRKKEKEACDTEMAQNMEEKAVLSEESESLEFFHGKPSMESVGVTGEETVVLYKNPEYDCPVLVSEEPGQAPSIMLNQEMIVIGKMDGVSDVLLDRASISRIHAKIQKKDQDYWVGDLNSKNGTFVNGKKLEKEEEYQLQPEDQVVFADISYRFVKDS